MIPAIQRLIRFPGATKPDNAPDKSMTKFFPAAFIIPVLLVVCGCTARTPPPATGAVPAERGVHIITASAAGNGAIEPSGKVAVKDGANILFTVIPDPGYGIVNVLVDGASAGDRDRYIFNNVTGPHAIEAVFGPIITASAGKGGIVFPKGAGVVAGNESKTYVIEPFQGYRTESVQVDGTAVGPVSRYTFKNVTGPHTIKATFAEADDRIITATVRGEGSIRPSGEVAVTYSTNALFVMTPAAGYKLFDVVVDGESLGSGKARYLFLSVTENHTIEAIFHPAIDASAGPGGYIWPNGTRIVDEVKKLTGMTYTFTPREGYRIEDVEVNGESVGAVPNYTFGEITEPQIIKVIFAGE